MRNDWLLIQALFTFFGTVILGWFVLRQLKSFKLAQTIREDGPASHLDKQGTPSMGGLMFVLPIIGLALLYLDVTLLPLVAMVGYGLIGVYDDLDKRVIKKSGGISIRRKLTLEILIGLVVSLCALYWYEGSSIGLSSRISISVHPIVFGAFVVFFLIAVTNGVNFTDGLDGLLTLVTLPVFALLAWIAHLQDNGPIMTFVLLSGVSLAAFLIFNRHPAKVFMGDTGSLFLGALIAGISIVLRVELLLLVFGLVYVLESLSVVIQIGYFRKTGGKRFFRMAPLHHHFELMGLSETKVVILFSLGSWLFCAIAGLIYLLA